MVNCSQQRFAPIPSVPAGEVRRRPPADYLRFPAFGRL